MSTELQAVSSRLEAAEDYLDIFGVCDGDGKTQEGQIKQVYRKLVRVVHPDRYTTDVEKQLAEAAFRLLQDFQESALQAVKTGIYGQLPVVVVRTKRFTHEVGKVSRKGDIADLHVSRTLTGTAATQTIVKLARRSVDSDLMEAEGRAIKKLLAADGDENFYPFFPQLIDSFTFKSSRGGIRRANVLEKVDGWYSLAEVRLAYPAGIEPLDMIWMWRKLLWTLGYAHQRGLVHGAVLPEHIMIQPEDHGLMLVDWCYSTSLPDDDSQPAPIKALAPRFRQMYPPEVAAKESPTPGTDIYMAVRSMAYLTGGDTASLDFGLRVPKGIRAFMRGCSQSNQRLRPQNAWQLLAEFDELLEAIGNPYYPRRFRPFHMPS